MAVESVPGRQDNMNALHDAIPLPLAWETARGAVRVGALTPGGDVLLARTDDREWGLVVRGPGRAVLTQARPARIEVYGTGNEGNEGDSAQVQTYARDYSSVRPVAGGYRGTAEVALPGGGVVTIEDSWTVAGGVLCLSRAITVAGDAPGGFLSAVTLLSDRPLSWVDINPFAPGMLYGWSEHVTGVAIGGVANYLGGVREACIQEDRLPAPLFGLHVGDGTSVALLDPAPTGDTTAADARDTEAVTLIDDRFHFLALGGYEAEGRVALGAWFPGTEGAVTDSDDTFPGAQRRRGSRRRVLLGQWSVRGPVRRRGDRQPQRGRQRGRRRLARRLSRALRGHGRRKVAAAGGRGRGLCRDVDLAVGRVDGGGRRCRAALEEGRVDRRPATDRLRPFAGRRLHGVGCHRVCETLSAHGGGALPECRAPVAAQHQDDAGPAGGHVRLGRSRLAAGALEPGPATRLRHPSSLVAVGVMQPPLGDREPRRVRSHPVRGAGGGRRRAMKDKNREGRP